MEKLRVLSCQVIFLLIIPVCFGKGRVRHASLDINPWESELKFQEQRWIPNRLDADETLVTEGEDETIFNYDYVTETMGLKTFLRYFESGKEVVHNLLNKGFFQTFFKILVPPDPETVERDEFNGRTTTAVGNYVKRWALSLVRQENVTLAVFLRSYRVELLYDLVFSTLKWIFFAWLGFVYP